jgi:hypothetical protein
MKAFPNMTNQQGMDLRDDIIRMAQEAWGEGKVYRFDSPKHWPEVEEMFVRFANLVSAAEREACAKVCDERAATHPIGSDEQCEAEDCAATIRARGQE